MTHKLYYSPGACSISPHIALRETQVPFDLVRVDLRTKKTADGGDYKAINPKGYVPALGLPDGDTLTEGVAIVQYIADQNPNSKLAPKAGTRERYHLAEMLNFISTELHKGISPLFNPTIGDEYKTSLKERLALRWGFFASSVRKSPWLFGDQFTVADGYAYYVMRAWQKFLKEDLVRWPELVDYYARIGARPSVVAAIAAEGIDP